MVAHFSAEPCRGACVASGEELTLRQLIKLEIEKLALELNVLRGEFRRMSDLLGSSSRELDVLKLQVAGLAESLHDLEIRVNGLEKHSGIATEVTRQAFTVFMLVVVAIAWGLFR